MKLETASSTPHSLKPASTALLSVVPPTGGTPPPRTAYRSLVAKGLAQAPASKCCPAHENTPKEDNMYPAAVAKSDIFKKGAARASD